MIVGEAEVGNSLRKKNKQRRKRKLRRGVVAITDVILETKELEDARRAKEMEIEAYRQAGRVFRRTRRVMECERECERRNLGGCSTNIFRYLKQRHLIY